MNKKFQVELSYLKGEEGSADQKQVNETYIFLAINYTDAETKVFTFAEQQGITNFSHKITAVKITDIIDQYGPSDFWLTKTSYIVTTPAGKEKVIKETQLVNAKDIQAAMDRVKEFFKAMSVTLHTRVIGVQESKVLEVIE